MNVVPLYTRAARRAVIAPDLPRYLDPRNVDLMVTDQVQAVKVRVQRGLEIFEARLRDGQAVVRRRLTLGAALFPVCIVVAYFSGRDLMSGQSVELWHWLIAGMAAAGVTGAMSITIGAGLDLRRLRRLSGRFRSSDLDGLETSREVLEYGEAILGEAQALGAVPPGAE